MNAEIPKQFMLLSGLPVLMHSIGVFYRYDPEMQLFVVLPEASFSYWNELCRSFSFTIHHQLVTGGPTRFHSVRNALDQISGEGLVAIHDGVRPLVSEGTLKRTFAEAENSGNAIPVIRMNESIRSVTEGGSVEVNREHLRIVQTPQVFRKELIKKAYSTAPREIFNDDATVFETLGIPLHLVAGNPENIKITLPSDLLCAEAILSSFVSGD
jgi:2-C-methyl-D-erythritol 4-phosphate cytidylyltransferase